MLRMVEGKDIYRVCLPLTAGVLCTSVLLSLVFIPQPLPYVFSGILSVLTCGLASVLYLSNRKHIKSSPPLSILFVLCGALLAINAGLLPVRDSLPAAFARTRDNLAALIDGIPFSDDRDNALVKALILGDRSSLPRETIREFRNAGAAHLLALSGMHLGIIYLLLSYILRILGNGFAARKCRSVAIIALCLLYTLMTGAAASCVRAWLFILLNECGKILDRPQNPKQVLCSALTIHLIFRPASIMEVGFQMSYLAMCGIVFVWPLMREWYNAQAGRKIWDAASLSISCQLFTAPLTLAYFHTFPKYFLITNLVAAPLMGIVMCCGIACVTMAALGTCCPTPFMICEQPLILLRRLLALISDM